MNFFAKLKALVMGEPALVVDFGETLVVLLVAYGVSWSTEQQGYLIAAIIAVAGLIKAVSVRPFAVTSLTDAVRAILVVAASVFGASLTGDQIAITATLVGTLFTLIARAQITPKNKLEPGVDADLMAA